MAFMGAQIRNESSMTEIEFLNFTNKLDYDTLNTSKPFVGLGNNQNASYIARSIGKYTDTLLFMAFDGSKGIVEYGYNNPHKPYKFAMYGLILPIFFAALIPLVYLLVFIYFGIRETILWIKKKTRQ